MRRVFPLVGSLVLLCAVVIAAPLAHAVSSRDAVLDIAFPVAGSVTFTDTYTANRGGGTRRHQATDIFGDKGKPVHAVVEGEICFAPGIGEPEPYYGYILRICADGITYSYVHLNNDSPGTDDGRGGYQAAYAPGIREGVRVSRGQLIGYLGDSGNAEDTPPHLHFAIYDPDLVDPALAESPWRQHYRNPYPSLVVAHASSASGVLRLGARGPAVRAWQEQLNTVASAGLVVDGVFGPGTERATIAFQSAQGLAADGVVGPATTAAMERLGNGSGMVLVSAQTGADGYGGRPLRLTDPPMRGDDVRAWQARMRARGWRGANGSPLSVDGIFGLDSDRAARLFQEEKGLLVDGVVGPSTWSAAFRPT